MLSFAGSLRVFVAIDPCDMRKGFDGLQALISERLGESATSGALFVFTNRRRNRLKILFWDRTGLWVCIKRLEEGTFSWPNPDPSGPTKLSLTPEALAMRVPVSSPSRSDCTPPSSHSPPKRWRCSPMAWTCAGQDYALGTSGIRVDISPSRTWDWPCVCSAFWCHQ